MCRKRSEIQQTLKLRVGTSCKQATYCRAKRGIELYVIEMLWLSRGWEADGFRLTALQADRHILFLLFTIQLGGCSEGVGTITEFVPWIIVW